jgi:hypothetical protein
MDDPFLIQYQPDIPEKLILEFKHDLQDFNVIVEKQTDSESEYAVSTFINDIIIYISQNQTALIVSGLIVRATYDLLKFSLGKLFTGLKKHIAQSNVINPEQKKISIKHTIGDKTIEFELETNLSDELYEKVIEQSFEILKDDNTQTILYNQDYLSKEFDYRQAKFIFNEQSGLWEPINYGIIRKKYEDSIKNVNQSFKE